MFSPAVWPAIVFDKCSYFICLAAKNIYMYSESNTTTTTSTTTDINNIIFNIMYSRILFF